MALRALVDEENLGQFEAMALQYSNAPYAEIDVDPRLPTHQPAVLMRGHYPVGRLAPN